MNYLVGGSRSKFYDRTHQFSKKICREMQDESRWTVETEFLGNVYDESIDADRPRYKIIRMIWSPSLDVYRYLFCIANPTFVNDEEMYRSGIFHIMKHYWWTENVKTFFDEDTKKIHIVWKADPQNLTHGYVNFGMDGLTAQEIRLVMRLPFRSGLVGRTKPSSNWTEEHFPTEEDRDERSTNTQHFFPSWLPIIQRYSMECYVSSNNGVYARNKGTGPEHGMRVPLKCVCRKHQKRYKSYNTGRNGGESE